MSPRYSRRVLIGRATAGVIAAGAGATLLPSLAQAARRSTSVPPTAPPSMPTAAFPVTIDHFIGTTTVETEPTRVLALTDFADLDNVVALGVTPVAFGFTDAWETGLTPWQLDAGIGELEQFAIIEGSPSVEAVASYEPDLIVAMPYAEPIYDDLTLLAPTVVLSWSETWRDALALVGAAVGRTEQADALRADVEMAIADAAAEIAAAVADVASLKVMVGSMYGEIVYVQGDESPVTQLLRELGLTVVAGPEPVLTELSLETLDLLEEADVLLSLATDPAGTAIAEASPLWQRLPAVAAGRYTAIEPVLSRGIGDGFNALSFDWVLSRITEIVIAAATGNGQPLG